jgi:hypothetical protein
MANNLGLWGVPLSADKDKAAPKKTPAKKKAAK